MPHLYNALRSSGTLPNFLITAASPKSPVAGSPVRLNAIVFARQVRLVGRISCVQIGRILTV